MGCGPSPASLVLASPTISFLAVLVQSEQRMSPVIYFDRRLVRVFVAGFAANVFATISISKVSRFFLTDWKRREDSHKPNCRMVHFSPLGIAYK
jgi:hypothetical protein